MRVSFVFNRLSRKRFDDEAIFLRRGEEVSLQGWNSLGSVTNSIRVIELNVYETKE